MLSGGVIPSLQLREHFFSLSRWKQHSLGWEGDKESDREMCKTLLRAKCHRAVLVAHGPMIEWRNFNELCNGKLTQEFLKMARPFFGMLMLCLSGFLTPRVSF